MTQNNHHLPDDIVLSTNQYENCSIRLSSSSTAILTTIASDNTSASSGRQSIVYTNDGLLPTHLSVNRSLRFKSLLREIYQINIQVKRYVFVWHGFAHVISLQVCMCVLARKHIWHNTNPVHGRHRCNITRGCYFISRNQFQNVCTVRVFDAIRTFHLVCQQRWCQCILFGMSVYWVCSQHMWQCIVGSIIIRAVSSGWWSLSAISPMWYCFWRITNPCFQRSLNKQTVHNEDTSSSHIDVTRLKDALA